MKKWPLISIVLAAIILASATFWFGVKTKNTLVETDSLSSTPDFFAQGIAILQYDKTGNLTQELHAKELKHNQTTKQTKLVAPLLIQYQDNNSWHIGSNFGDITKETDILLSGNVTATKDEGTDKAVTLLADKMLLNSTKNIIKGTGNITINSAQTNIQADSITLLINSNEINLEGSVRGTHEATQ